jgi:putative ABC transport system permease protein
MGAVDRFLRLTVNPIALLSKSSTGALTSACLQGASYAPSYNCRWPLVPSVHYRAARSNFCCSRAEIDMWQDIRLAVRGFRRTPVFSMVAIVTLALATGANTALFGLLNGLVWRDIAVRDPRTLVQVSAIRPGSASGSGLTFSLYEKLQREQRVFSAVIGWLGPSIVSVETDHDQAQAAVWVVSGNFFDELGIRPFAGRLLGRNDVDELTLEPQPVAVMGYKFWQQHYGSDRRIVGQRVRVQNEWFEIVGIAPAGFRALDLTIEPDVILPLTAFPLIADSSQTSIRSNTSLWVQTTGRLTPGTTIAQARATLDALWPELKAATVPPQYAGLQRDRFLAMSLSVECAAKGIEQSLRDTFTRPLVIVLAIALLIFLIAAVNLASLMLSRAATRAHEMGVRLALGAGGWRIARQTLVEGVVLSVVGTACGVWLAYGISDALMSLMLRDYLVSASLRVAPDGWVLAFASTMAILAGMLLSVAPAWLGGRLEATALLRQGTRTSSATGRVGSPLVAGQVALSLVLLTNAGLLIRTLRETRAVDSGLRSADVFVASLAPRPSRQTVPNKDAYYSALIDRVSAVPGVKRVAVSLFRPAGGSGGAEPVWRIGDPIDQAGFQSLFMAASPGLFDALGIAVRTGRDFQWDDNSRSRSVAVVSESLARRLFASESAIGKHLRVGSVTRRENVEIVGVVADARLYDVKDSKVFAVYVPALQEGDNDYKSLVIRGTRVSDEGLNRAVGSFGYDRIRFIRTLDYIAGRALLRERITAMLATFFGGLALLLAGIGLYGLMSHAVALRRREIGIRMALGADVYQVMRGIVTNGLTITGLGVGTGLVGSLVSVRLVESLLFGVSPYDPTTFIAMAAALLAAAMVGCLVPAARAARTDPTVALRAD